VRDKVYASDVMQLQGQKVSAPNKVILHVWCIKLSLSSSLTKNL